MIVATYLTLALLPLLAFTAANILYLGKAAAAKGVASNWLLLTGLFFPPIAWAYVIAAPTAPVAP